LIPSPRPAIQDEALRGRLRLDLWRSPVVGSGLGARRLGTEVRRDRRKERRSSSWLLGLQFFLFHGDSGLPVGLGLCSKQCGLGLRPLWIL
jgi:hypothetical protein